MSTLLPLVLFPFFSADADIDLGAADQKEPPPAKSRMIPKNDDTVKKVGLHAAVAGTVPKGTKSHVYVLASPLSNPDIQDTWWVQDAVEQKGEKFTGIVQCGEADAGVNEYFAVVVVVTDETYEVGQQLKGLPKAKSYSKLTIVKRTK
jgi:hypothetical protein